jgi:hypothetical protein
MYSTRDEHAKNHTTNRLFKQRIQNFFNKYFISDLGRSIVKPV